MESGPLETCIDQHGAIITTASKDGEAQIDSEL